MKVRTYKQAINYLEGFIGKIVFKVDKKSAKKHDPLERMRIYLSLLGNPQDKFKSVLVGGTSGKGSTAYLISHILTTSGYKTGFTISPHLQKVNERLQINNKEISDEKLTEIVISIVQTIELMKKMEIGAPSYFEILIGMAFVYFMSQKVDIAVVEVGMGGEFDATNTLNPLVAVLTNVGLDHTNVLGKTVEKIAKTKAGIIKNEDLRLKIKEYNHQSLIINRKSPIVVSAVTQQSVIKIVEDRCDAVGAKLNLLWRDFGYKIKKMSQKGSVFDLMIPSGRGVQLNDLQLSLIGKYQVENAALAIKTVLELGKLGFKVTDSAIKKALKSAFFPGRFEVIRGPVKNKFQISNFKFQIVLDGAHNPTKMKEFLKSLKKLFPKEKKIFVVGFKFDKDIKKMLKEIRKVADEIIVTEFKGKTDTKVHASADADSIKYEVLSMKYRGKIIVEKDSKKALKIGIKAIQQYNNSAILVVTGSLYLVGEIRSML